MDKEQWRRLYLRLKYGFSIPDYDGMMDETKCRFLYEMVCSYKGPKNLVVEIGSYKGCSTTWLGMAARRNGFEGLVAIDLFTGTPSWNRAKDTYGPFMARMRKNKLDTFVQAIRGDSKDVAERWDAAKPIAILHIDGDHAYEAAKADVDNYLPYVQPEGLLIIDDYDSAHPDVQKLVDEMLAGGRFQVAGEVKENKAVKEGYGSIALKKGV